MRVQCLCLNATPSIKSSARLVAGTLAMLQSSTVEADGQPPVSHCTAAPEGTVAQIKDL